MRALGVSHGDMTPYLLHAEYLTTSMYGFTHDAAFFEVSAYYSLPINL